MVLSFYLGGNFWKFGYAGRFGVTVLMLIWGVIFGNLAMLGDSGWTGLSPKEGGLLLRGGGYVPGESDTVRDSDTVS